MKSFLLLVALSALTLLPLSAEDAKPAGKITNVTPDQAEKILKENPKAMVLDVRTPEEFKSGHIPGAKNLDLFSDDFKKQVAAIDPKTPLVVHCAAGGRSKQSLEFLKDKQAVYHLNEGFKAWQKAGKPVEK
jgi:phage shock protein E